MGPGAVPSPVLAPCSSRSTSWWDQVLPGRALQCSCTVAEPPLPPYRGIQSGLLAICAGFELAGTARAASCGAADGPSEQLWWHPAHPWHPLWSLGRSQEELVREERPVIAWPWRCGAEQLHPCLQESTVRVTYSFGWEMMVWRPQERMN